jgi:hypothetical protein
MIPGRTLHRLAVRVCSSTTLERVIEPILADIQKECADTIGQHRTWRCRWIIACGYAVLFKALALYLIERSMGTSLAFTRDDRRNLLCTCAWAALLTAGMTGALVLVPLLSFPLPVPSRFRAVYLIALIPQALPLALPSGLTLAIIAALKGRLVSPASKRSIYGVAVLCAVGSFAVMAWVMPRANQAFRAAAFQDAGNQGTPKKGTAELSLSELQRERAVALQLGDVRRARSAQIALHLRWSIACTSALMAAFALSIVTRFGTVGRGRLILLACAVFAAYFLIANSAEYLARGGDFLAVAAVWLPNLMLFVGSLTLRIRDRQQAVSEVSVP